MSQRKGRPAERAVRAPEASVLALTRETCTMTVSKTSLRKSAKGRLCERFLQQEALVQKGMIEDWRTLASAATPSNARCRPLQAGVRQILNIRADNTLLDAGRVHVPNALLNQHIP